MGTEQPRLLPALHGVSIVVPAYNEEQTVAESLERLSAEVDSHFHPYEIIVVSDGSTDETIGRAKASLARHLSVVDLPANVGKGRAIIEGVRVARYDIVALCDADLDLHPEMLTPMIQSVQRNLTDVAVGSKRHRDSLVNYPRWRRLQSAVYQRLCRLLFDLDISDTQTGQKAMRRSDLVRALPDIRTTGFAFDLDLLVKLHDSGKTITEFPIVLTYAYSSTVSVTTAFQVAKETLHLRLQSRRGKEMR